MTTSFAIHLGEDFAGTPLQLSEIDAPLRCVGHRCGDLRPHNAAAQPRGRTAGVDDRADAQALIDGFIGRPAHRAASVPVRHGGAMTTALPRMAMNSAPAAMS
jgi:hypothetical protein